MGLGRKDEVLEIMLELCDADERRVLMENLHDICNQDLREMALDAERYAAAMGRANAERHLAPGQGIGPLTHRMHPYEKMHEKVIFGHDSDDPEFLKSRYFNAKYPHARVNCGGEKEIQVGWTPTEDQVSSVQFQGEGGSAGTLRPTGVTPILGPTGKILSVIETQVTPQILI